MTIINDSDFHRIFGSSECAGIEETMERTRHNLHEFTLDTVDDGKHELEQRMREAEGQ